jgi:hypothetical protein
MRENCFPSASCLGRFHYCRRPPIHEELGDVEVNNRRLRSVHEFVLVGARKLNTRVYGFTQERLCIVWHGHIRFVPRLHAERQ